MMSLKWTEEVATRADKRDGNEQKKGTPHSGIPFCLQRDARFRLFNGYRLRQLFLFFGRVLGQGDGQDTVFHLGADLVAFHILGQREHLLELHRAELFAQEVALLVTLFFLILVLHLDDKVVVGVDAEVEVFLLHTGDADFEAVVLVAFADIHFRGHRVILCAAQTVPAVPVKKLVEHCAHQVVVSSCY